MVDNTDGVDVATDSIPFSRTSFGQLTNLSHSVHSIFPYAQELARSNVAWHFDIYVCIWKLPVKLGTKTVHLSSNRLDGLPSLKSPRPKTLQNGWAECTSLFLIAKSLNYLHRESNFQLLLPQCINNLSTRHSDLLNILPFQLSMITLQKPTGTPQKHVQKLQWDVSAHPRF